MTDGLDSFGRRSLVPLRQVWKSEADFTGWLAEEDNLRHLGNAIGLDGLKFEAREKEIGPFRADLVCGIKDATQKVLIENQIEKANHEHLGKLLTYAADLKPVTMVWIAGQFIDQYKVALDWLNEITDDRFTFFGIEVETATIDDSRPAVDFNIVAKPKGWNRKVRRQGTAKRKKAGTTGIQQLRSEYWTAFRSYLKQHGFRREAQGPRDDNGLHFMIGKDGIRLEAIAPGRTGEIRVNLIFYQERRGPDFDSLQEEKETIHKQIGERLEWEKRTEKRWRIRIRRSAELDQRHAWEEQHAWLMEHLEAFYQVFAPRIGAFGNDAPLQKEAAVAG